MRKVEHSRHDAVGVGVRVDGWEHQDGRLEVAVSVREPRIKTLTAAEARSLAAALMAAAAEADEVTRPPSMIEHGGLSRSGLWDSLSEYWEADSCQNKDCKDLADAVNAYLFKE